MYDGSGDEDPQCGTDGGGEPSHVTRGGSALVKDVLEVLGEESGEPQEPKDGDGGPQGVEDKDLVGHQPPGDNPQLKHPLADTRRLIDL